MSYSKTSPKTIQDMFAKISSRYDLCNKALSFNLHKLWNRALVAELLKREPPKKVLDLCAGTGDIALEFSRQQNGIGVTLLDFCAPMLGVARQKAEIKGIKETDFSYVEGDAMHLPFNDDTFSHVSIAYGIRNVNTPLKCVQEAHRVLRSGGAFGILELTRPENQAVRLMHAFYLKTFVPLIGSIVTQDREAYQYLNRSIKQFQTAAALEEMLRATGFDEIRTIPLNLGIASIIVGVKK